jgi:site-specific recombinase XerD
MTQASTFWCIDATFISSGTLLLVVDLASRIILGDLYLHGLKSNQFQAEHVALLVKKCLIERRLDINSIELVIHSDQGKPFQSDAFKQFCEQHAINRSITKVPRGNQVIESLNATIKKNIRLRIDAEAQDFKPGSWADPIRKLAQHSKEEIMRIIQFAIESHNNKTSDYNQSLTPNEFDIALHEHNLQEPSVLKARNDQSERAKAVQVYRDEVTLNYAGNWAEFFANWKKSQDKEFESARLEREALARQNRELLRKMDSQSAKMDSQSALLMEQKEQIQRLIDELNKRVIKERLEEEKRAKRKAAKKQPPRDAITPKDFQSVMDNLNLLTPKTARIKVALTLLYLTGLSGSNLLELTVQNLQELMQKHRTLPRTINRGDARKIVIATDAKHWLQQIKRDIELLIEGKQPQDPFFTNIKGEPISRVLFNEQLNDALKAVACQIGKRIYTHSFRVTLITELLQAQPIQSVKRIIGHKDIRTTEIYDRNFMGERELHKAMQFVYKNRKTQSRHAEPEL